MEILAKSVFWIGLVQIIWINILLSADNAVVIALASRSLPGHQQKQAIVWGSVAAIVTRVILTVFAVQVLQLPWLKAVGAVLLVWIGVQLLGDEGDEGEIKAAGNLLAAIKTILLADLVMSLDNILAVAAAADSAHAAAKTPLVICGLALSIPFVIFGSRVVLTLMQKFPIIITLGGMLLGWIAGDMLAREEILLALARDHVLLPWALAGGGALLVLAIGKAKARLRQPAANT